MQDLLPSLGICCDPEFLLNNLNLSPSCYESVARRCLFVGLRAILGNTGHFLPDFSHFPRMEYWLHHSLSSTDMCPDTLLSSERFRFQAVPENKDVHSGEEDTPLSSPM